MHESWIISALSIICILALALIINGIRSKEDEIRSHAVCPVNDSIHYLTDIKYFSCPVQGQQLTVVRQSGYATYANCACPK